MTDEEVKRLIMSAVSDVLSRVKDLEREIQKLRHEIISSRQTDARSTLRVTGEKD